MYFQYMQKHVQNKHILLSPSQKGSSFIILKKNITTLYSHFIKTALLFSDNQRGFLENVGTLPERQAHLEL